MRNSWEIQKLIAHGQFKTVRYADTQPLANKAFMEVLERHRGEAFRLIQVSIDFTTMHKPGE